MLTPAMKAEIFRSTVDRQGLPMLSYPHQAAVHSARARFQVWDWGRRAGKSETGGREAHCQLVIPESRVWVAGPTMDLAEKEFRVVWRLNVEEAGLPGRIPVKRKSARELWIEFANGSYIECRSEEAGANQFVGEGIDLVLVVEAARMAERSWTEQLRPTLADRKGRAIFSSTPRGFNWFHDYFLRGQPDLRHKYPNWRSWKIPSSANPLVEADEVEDARLTLPDSLFKQEWLAEFTNFSGKVFEEFNENVHVRRHDFEPYLKTQLWSDPGITNPYSVLLVQLTPDETVRVIDEVYVQGKISEQVIQMCEEKWPYALLSGDTPRSDLTVVVDEAAAEAMATWRLKGYYAIGGKPGVAQGIEVIHRMLRDPFRSVDPDEENPLGLVPRLTIHPQCANTIREFGSYHYPDDSQRRANLNSGEVPVDKDNHSISAIRYGLYAEYPALFNQRVIRPEDEYLSFSVDDLGEQVTKMRMDDSYSIPRASEYGGDRRFSLGDY